MLVPTNRLAALVDDALERVGVPAVINGAGSVFATPAADEWLRLLEAVERPVSTARARSAALTSFLGWSAEQMAAADEPAWEELHAKLHRWAGLLRSRGVAALLDSISATEAVPRRVLARLGGERRLTDLGHVGQLLHTAATEQQLGVSSLTAWLRQRIADADRDGADEDRALRLDSDAEAVQVLTIHRSKGLEFPIVYHPFAWQPGYIDQDEPPAYHDDQNDDAWTIDVGGNGPDIARHRRLRDREQRGEDLRLLYVALTRTMHQATVWWAGACESHNSSLGRLLFARDADGVVAAEGTRTPDDDEVVARLEALAERRRRAGSRSRGSRRRPARAGRASRARRVELDASTLRAHARRALATGLVQRHRLRRARAAGGDASPRSTSSTTSCSPPRRRRTRAPSTDAEEQRLRAAPAPLAAMPGGADVGDLLHRVLEATDFASRRPRGRARRAPGRAATPPRRRHRRHRHRDRRARRRDRDAARASAGRDPAPRRRGGRPARRARLRAAARRRRHADGHARPERSRLAARDAPSRRRPAGAATPTACATRSCAGTCAATSPGRSTSSSAPAATDGSARYALVDYKSNWLGADGEELSAWHYRPAALAEAMQRAHYPLQALLYLAALHRYLRGRLPDYDADTAPRRRPLPVPSRDDRPGHAARRRAAVRRLRLAAAGAARRGAERPARPRSDGDVSALETVDLHDARYVRRATGTLRAFNEAGVLAAADVHVAAPPRAARRRGGREHAARGRAGRARTPARIGLRRPRHDRAPPQPPTSTIAGRPAGAAVAGTRGLGRRPRLEPARRRRRGRRGGPAAPSRRHDALPRPLLAGRALRRRRPPRPQRARERRRRRPCSPTGWHGCSTETSPTSSASPPRPACCADSPSSAAAPAPARRPPSPASSSSSTSRPRPPARRRRSSPSPHRPGRPPRGCEEAVHEEASALELSEPERARLLETRASTLHRLLGRRAGSANRFRHDRRNQLPHDVVIVDETSMVSLSLMARLLEAVRRDARLILVGDPKQLASVEAGAVLGDLVGPAADALLMREPARARLAEVAQQTVPATEPPAGVAIGDGIVVLRRVHRFAGAIADLAEAVRGGDAEAALAILRAGHDDVRWIDVDIAEPDAREALRPVREAAVAAGRRIVEAARAGDAAAAIAALGAFRLLCAHRRGPYGVATWNAVVESWLANELDRFAEDAWYVGRPLLVTQNDYGLRLFNGDTGVIVARERRPQERRLRASGRARRDQPDPARRRRHRPRADDPQEPGLAGRRSRSAPPRPDLPHPDQRAAVHRRHPRPDTMIVCGTEAAIRAALAAPSRTRPAWHADSGASPAGCAGAGDVLP